MPTVLHDLLVDLAARRPELLLEMTTQLGVELPIVDEVTELRGLQMLPLDIPFPVRGCVGRD